MLFFTLDIYPGVELLNPMVILFLSAWGNLVLFSLEAGLIYIPNNSILALSFQRILLTLIICCLSESSYSKMCVVILWFWYACIRLVQKESQFLHFAVWYWNTFLNMVMSYVILMHISWFMFFCWWLVTCYLFIFISD